MILQLFLTNRTNLITTRGRSVMFTSVSCTRRAYPFPETGLVPSSRPKPTRNFDSLSHFQSQWRCLWIIFLTLVNGWKSGTQRGRLASFLPGTTTLGHRIHGLRTHTRRGQHSETIPPRTLAILMATAPMLLILTMNPLGMKNHQNAGLSRTSSSRLGRDYLGFIRTTQVPFEEVDGARNTFLEEHSHTSRCVMRFINLPRSDSLIIV
mmetsp:Transcript_29437/g.43418  ORF Transcript_29437/g.43418 Transcript_29437/m.43418 type:complete len:208 (+) Transcript_29437:1338-1961(+)